MTNQPKPTLTDLLSAVAEFNAADTVVEQEISQQPFHRRVAYLTKNSERLSLFKSQKGTDLVKARKAFDSVASMPTFVLLTLDDEDWVLETAWLHVSDGHRTCFLRTCPLNPRHGVLESIKVNDRDDFLRQYRRLAGIMHEEDPDGCLMLMPFVTAVCSSVAALTHEGFNGYVTFGPGHDGVTAGHGTQLSFPLVDDYMSNALKHMGKDVSQVELEFVYGAIGNSDMENLLPHRTKGLLDGQSIRNARQYLTQIRGAAEHIDLAPPPRGVDIMGMVPQGEVIVADSIIMSGLEEVAWLEENITADTPDGFVVVEPNGSLLSHICAHCRGVGIPYIITDTVATGDRWVEAAAGWVARDNDGVFEPAPYTPSVFADDFLAGIEFVNKHYRQQHGWLSTFFHQFVSTPMANPQHTAFLGGMFVGWLAKSVLALGAGEARHSHNLNKNYHVAHALLPMAILRDGWTHVDNPVSDNFRGMFTRRSYYFAVERSYLDWGVASKTLDFLSERVFTTKAQSGWSGGYGGKKWGDSCAAGARLCRAISQFKNAPTEQNFSALVVEANACENAQHNNGFLFNKWLSQRAFDVGTKGWSLQQDKGTLPATYLMAMQAIEIQYGGKPMPKEAIEFSATTEVGYTWEAVFDSDKFNHPDHGWWLQQSKVAPAVRHPIVNLAFSLSEKQGAWWTCRVHSSHPKPLPESVAEALVEEQIAPGKVMLQDFVTTILDTTAFDAYPAVTLPSLPDNVTHIIVGMYEKETPVTTGNLALVYQAIKDMPDHEQKSEWSMMMNKVVGRMAVGELQQHMDALAQMMNEEE